MNLVGCLCVGRFWSLIVKMASRACILVLALALVAAVGVRAGREHYRVSSYTAVHAE